MSKSEKGEYMTILPDCTSQLKQEIELNPKKGMIHTEIVCI